MYHTFEELPAEKKELIMEACIEEFAHFGYVNASTNRIVKKIDISKGSLFKYFNTKEELYIYILDYVITNMTQKLSRQMKDLPDELFERVAKVAELEFDLYLENPNIYHLFKKAFSEKTQITIKLKEKYKLEAHDFFDVLFKEVNLTHLKYDQDKVFKLIKWFLEGYNEEFIANFDHNSNLVEMKSAYLKELSAYLEMLKKGISY